MSDRKAAAITHFVVGGLTLASGLKGLIAPGEHYTSLPVWNEFLFKYGGPLSALLVGGALIAVGAGYSVTCGEHRMDLGPVEVRAPQVALISAAEMRAAAGRGAPVKARYRCLPGSRIAVRLAPTDAGHPIDG